MGSAAREITNHLFIFHILLFTYGFLAYSADETGLCKLVDNFSIVERSRSVY